MDFDEQFSVTDDDGEQWTWVPAGRRLDFGAMPPPAPRDDRVVPVRYALDYVPVAPEVLGDPVAAGRFLADWKAFDAAWAGPPKSGPNLDGRAPSPPAPRPRRWRLFGGGR